VPDDQLSLAIGREGQNARLAAKLTGWRIDIKSVSEAAEKAYAGLQEPPLDTLQAEMPDLVAEVERIMEKKLANRPVQPEEYKTLTEFVKIAERHLQAVREAGRSTRRAAMSQVRDLVPDRAYRMAIEELELDEDINRALARIENVGELMVRVLADAENLEHLLEQGGAGEDAMEAIRYALDDLVILRAAEPEPEVAPEPEPEPLAEAETVPEAAAEMGAEPAQEKTALVMAALAEEEAAMPAFVEPEPLPLMDAEEAAELERRVRSAGRLKTAGDVDDEDIFDEEEGGEAERGKKKSKSKRRELVFDEERGEVVARRRRKGGRRRGDWDEYLE